MTQAQLFQYFKDNGITIEDIAEKTGYTVLYVTNLLFGYDCLNDRARFRILKAYPETAAFLLPSQSDVVSSMALSPAPASGSKEP